MPINLFTQQDTLNQLFSTNKVVIMEDSDTNKETIISILKNQLQCKVIVCDNQDQVIETAKSQRPDLFILDNCIENNPQEGFNALERIKHFDKSIFVAILTAFSTENIRRQAINLDCNLFMEKTNIEQNVIDIVKKMLENRRKQIEGQLDFIEKLEKDYKDQPYSPKNKNVYISEHKQAQNRKAYEECKSNPDWLKQHQGNYAAFVDGEFKFSEKDKDKFFDQLNNSDEDKEKQIFVAEVGQKEVIIEESTSLWFELI